MLLSAQLLVTAPWPSRLGTCPYDLSTLLGLILNCPRFPPPQITPQRMNLAVSFCGSVLQSLWNRNLRAPISGPFGVYHLNFTHSSQPAPQMNCPSLYVHPQSFRVFMAPNFNLCCPASAFCLSNRCKVLAVFMFTSLINNEVEHLFVSILDFLFCKLQNRGFWYVCIPNISFAHFLLDLSPFPCGFEYLLIYIVYESLVGFIFFLVGFRHCKYLWLFILQTCQAHQPSGIGLAILSAYYVLSDTCRQGFLGI